MKNNERFKALRNQARFFRPSFQEIKKAVLDHIGEGADVIMKSKRSTATYSHAWAMIYLVCREFAYSFPEIARGYGQASHSSAVTACYKCKTDDAIKRRVMLIVGKILANHSASMEYRTRVEIAMEFVGVTGEGAFNLYQEMVDKAADCN